MAYAQGPASGFVVTKYSLKSLFLEAIAWILFRATHHGPWMAVTLACVQGQSSGINFSQVLTYS